MSPNHGLRVSSKQSRKMGQHNTAYVTEMIDGRTEVSFDQNGNDTRNTTTPTNSTVPENDIITHIIGDFGIWQLRTVLIIFLCKMPVAWFMACLIFTGPELYPGIEFECDPHYLKTNQTITNDQCYIEDTVAGTRIECTQFQYHFDFHSLVMQFDLVCVRDIFVTWTQYWHLFGVMLGGVVGTKMMIFISPRNVYFIAQVSQIVCGLITGYARDFSMHCGFRYLTAACCGIMFTSGSSIFSDITSGSYRLGALILFDTFWSIGLIFLPFISALFNSWTGIYLGITLPTFILMFLLRWTPDSPRWLLKNGNATAVDQVAAIVREGAAVNDRLDKIPPDFNQQLQLLREQLQSAPPPAKWLELWKGPRAKTHMLAAHLAMAAFIINFMGMLLNIRSFGRDFLARNMVANAISEIVGCFLALHFTLKMDKWKWQWAGGFNIVGGLIGCLGWTFSQTEMSPEWKSALWMLIASVPKAGASCAQSMYLACMSEVMPPNKKIPYVFSVVTWARLWLPPAPFLNLFKEIDVALALTSYCCLSIFGGICTCFMLTPSKGKNGEKILEKYKVISAMPQSVWTVEKYENTTCL